MSISKGMELIEFFSVVGEKERSNKTVNVRTRDNVVHGEINVDNLIEKFDHFRNSQTLSAEEMF